jgi:exopolysaccharide production protein ExoQ
MYKDPSESEDGYSQGITWTIFLFLTAIFFLAHHNLLASKEFIQWTDSSDIAEATLEGNIQRRFSLFLLGFFGIVCFLRSPSKRMVMVNSLSWAILLYVTLGFASLFWAQDLSLTFRRLVAFSMLAIGALGVARRLSEEEVVLFAFSSCGFLLLIGICTEIVLGTFSPGLAGYRFAGTIHPGHQGWNCGFLLLSSIILAGRYRRITSFFLFAAFVALVFLVLTKSRSAFASAALASVVYFSVKSSRARKGLLIHLSALGWSLILLYLLFGYLMISTAWEALLLGRMESADSLSGRVPVWKECVAFIMKRPMTGYGFNSFWTPGHILEISEKAEWGVPGAHNGYLDIVLGLGILGGITFVAILFLSIRRSLSLYTKTRNHFYAFSVAILVFYSLVMLMDVIASAVSIQNLIFYIVLVKVAFIAPPSPGSRTLSTYP